MFTKTVLALSMLAFFAAGASASTFVCTNAVDAQETVAAAVLEPSLEIGAGAKTIALINDKIAGGLCAKTEDLDISLGNVAMSDAADGIKLGVAATNVGYAVVVEGILNF